MLSATDVTQRRGNMAKPGWWGGKLGGCNKSLIPLNSMAKHH